MTPTDTLILLHIPKTAGSALRRVLTANFEDPSVIDLRDEPGRARDALIATLDAGRRPEPGALADRNARYVEVLRALPPEQLARCRLLLGHVWLGIDDVLPNPCTYLTMLRRPVDRVLSLYRHRVAHQGLTRSLGDYLSDGVDWEIDNAQTRRLCGATGRDPRFGPCTDDMLAAAKHNLEHRFCLVGVTERFEEAAVLLRRELGWPAAGHVRANVGRGAATLDADQRRLVEARNEADAELHRFASELMDRRIAAEPAFHREVQDLRDRVNREERRRRVVERLKAPVRRARRRLRV